MFTGNILRHVLCRGTCRIARRQDSGRQRRLDADTEAPRNIREQGSADGRLVDKGQ